jgi:protein O-mannosyl-transferase
VLAYLLISTNQWGHPTEFDPPPAINYTASQPGVLLYYLRLCYWPDGLCLDYRWPPVPVKQLFAPRWNPVEPHEVLQVVERLLPGLIVLGALGLATLWGLIRNRPWAFLGAWFFFILAPTSSFMPLADLAFEHRMYLPLMAVLTLTVMGGYLAGKAVINHETGPWPARAYFILVGAYLAMLVGLAMNALLGWTSLPWWGLLIMAGAGGLAAAIASLAVETYCTPGRDRWLAMTTASAVAVLLACIMLGTLSFQRNKVYQDEVSLWQDTAAKAPWNARAHDNLGALLCQRARIEEAMGHFQQALAIDPKCFSAHNNISVALFRTGKLDEAIKHAHLALELRPHFPHVYCNLGLALCQQGKYEEAIAQYQKALQIDKTYSQAHSNLGLTYLQMGRVDEAIAEQQKVLEANKDDFGAWANLGMIARQQNKLDDALFDLQKAITINPGFADGYMHLGQVLLQKNRREEAFNCFAKAVTLKPMLLEAKLFLGQLLYERGQPDGALNQWGDILKLQPNYVPALRLFAWVRATSPYPALRNAGEAVAMAERAAALTRGNDPVVLDTLAVAYAEAGRFPEAVRAEQAALMLGERLPAGMIPLGDMRMRLALFQENKPFHEPPPKPAMPGGAFGPRMR